MFVAWRLLGLAAVRVAMRPANAPLPKAATMAGNPVEDVAIAASDGITIRGWLVRAAADSHRCVVPAAGVHGNRLAMRERATWYLQHGWWTLLVDLRGTGASDAAPITTGWHEARDLLAVREWAAAHGFAAIGAHGCSLGAAAVVYAGDVPWAFAVLESCYRDIEAALTAGLWFVPFPRLAFWPLRTCAEWALGCAWTDLSPATAVAGLHCPTLVLCGDRDELVGEDATAALLAHSPAARKLAVAIAGAGHEDLWTRAPDVCARALAQFVP